MYNTTYKEQLIIKNKNKQIRHVFGLKQRVFYLLNLLLIKYL